MDDKPTQDLATRAFQKRVLDEFAAVRAEQAAMRAELADMRTDVADLRVQQAAMAKNIAAIDQRLITVEQRLTTLEDRVDERLKETRPIWEGVQMQLQRLTEKFDGVLLEFSELRGELRIHGKRLGELERRVLS